MSRIRVCHIIPTLDRGGAEKQLCLLAAGLPKDQFDVEVIVLTRTGPREADLREAGVPVHVIGKSSKFSPRTFLRLVKTLKRLRPDIVHTWIFAANAYGRAAARLAKVPHVIAGERCVDLWKSERHFSIDRFLGRWTDRIVTNSSGVVDFYRQHGIPESKFQVIPNGISPRTTRDIPRDETFQRLGVDPQRFLIGAVGRLWPQKRYRDMICAMDLLGVVRPDVTLAIIGDGPQRDELLRYRDQVTEPHWVRFVGEREDVAELLPHFDLFWLCSGYEGQSNSLMEAMQAGRAIVASDIPGNRDLIVHGECGLLVPVGETAEFAKQSIRLLENPDLRQQFGQAAMARIARDFTVAGMIQRHCDLYHSLVQR